MIPLYVENGIACLWNAEDWYTLRSKHRICSSLIGSVPSFPRQNDYLGLPMLLMSEEASLLVLKGVCELYELSNIKQKPSEEEKQEIKETEERVLTEQTEAFRKRRIEQLSQKIDLIFAGKKQKLLSKGITDIQLDKNTLLQEEINKLPNLLPAHTLVHLPAEHLLKSEKHKVKTDILKPSILEGPGALRFAVYRKLWDDGYFITSGSKFGCDYLVYPGDPVKFHAMYMVRCVQNQSTCFSPSSLVAFGRLSVAVNKLAVLAFWNSNNEVEFQTLQWHDSVNG